MSWFQWPINRLSASWGAMYWNLWMSNRILLDLSAGSLSGIRFQELSSIIFPGYRLKRLPELAARLDSIWLQGLSGMAMAADTGLIITLVPKQLMEVLLFRLCQLR